MNSTKHFEAGKKTFVIFGKSLYFAKITFANFSFNFLPGINFRDKNKNNINKIAKVSAVKVSMLSRREPWEILTTRMYFYKISWKQKKCWRWRVLLSSFHSIVSPTKYQIMYKIAALSCNNAVS